MPPLETSVGAAILLSPVGDCQKILLTRRSVNKRSHPGHWELPGGAVEDGESGEQAIRREVKEELGLELGEVNLRLTDLSYHEGTRFVVFLYSGWFKQEELHLNSWEIEDSRLVGLQEEMPEPMVPRVREQLAQRAHSAGISFFDQKAKAWDQQAYRVERAAVVAQAIRQAVPQDSRKRVLDFGCGTGLLGLNFLAEADAVTFADTSAGMLEQVRAKLAAAEDGKGRVVNLQDQVLPTGNDLIVSLMTLHHIPDTRKTVETLAGALSPGGSLCLCDLDHEDGSFHTEEVVPHAGFDRTVIYDAMQGCGLSVLSSTTPFVNRRGTDVERLYPVFLIVGRAP